MRSNPPSAGTPCFVIPDLIRNLTIKQQTLKRVQGDSSFGFSLVWADPYLVIPNPPCLVTLNLFQGLLICSKNVIFIFQTQSNLLYQDALITTTGCISSLTNPVPYLIYGAYYVILPLVTLSFWFRIFVATFTSLIESESLFNASNSP